MFNKMGAMKTTKESKLTKLRLKFEATPRKVIKVVKAEKPKPVKRRTTKKSEKSYKLERYNAIIGIGLLFVFVSIAYSTTIVLMGVDSLESKLLLIPQCVFALCIAVIAFSKLFK